MAKQTAPTQAEIEQLSPEDQASYKKLLAASKGFYTLGEDGKKTAIEEDPSYKPLMGQASKAVRALMGRHKEVAASAIESEIKRNRDNPDRDKRRSAGKAIDTGAAVVESELEQLGTERELRKVARNKKKFMKDFPTSTDIADVKQRVVLASQGREKVTDSDGITRVVGGTNRTVTTDVPVRKGAKKTKKVTSKVPTGEAGKESPVLPIEANIRKNNSKFQDAQILAEDLGVNSSLDNTIPLIQKGTGFIPSKSFAKRMGIDTSSYKPDQYGRIGSGGRRPTNREYVSSILYAEGWGDTPDEELTPTNMQDAPELNEEDVPVSQRSDNPASIAYGLSTFDTDRGATATGGTSDLETQLNESKEKVETQIEKEALIGQSILTDIIKRAESSGRTGSNSSGILARQFLDATALSNYVAQGAESILPQTANPVSEALSNQSQQLTPEQLAISEKELNKVAPEDRERIRRAGALSAQFDLNELRLRQGERDRGDAQPVFKDRTFFLRKGALKNKLVPDIDTETGKQKINPTTGKKMYKKGITQEVMTSDVKKGKTETYDSLPPNSVLTGNATDGNNPVEEAIVNAEAASDNQLLDVNRGKVKYFDKNNPTLTAAKVLEAEDYLQELNSTDRTGFSEDDHNDLDAQISDAEFNLNKTTSGRKKGIGSLGLRQGMSRRIGRTETDIGLDPDALAKIRERELEAAPDGSGPPTEAEPEGSTPQRTELLTRGKGKSKRLIIRRPKSFVTGENNTILEEMNHDAYERSMQVPKAYTQGTDYRVGLGNRGLADAGSEALPAGVKAQLGTMVTNVADPMDDVLNFNYSTKVDEDGNLTEPGVLRQMKPTRTAITATGKTTQEVGQDIIKNNPQSVGLAAIAAASVEPAARQRMLQRANGWTPPLLSNSQFYAKRVAAGKMSKEQEEDANFADEYDVIAHKEEGERLLHHVNALNERRPQVEQALSDHARLESVRTEAEDDMQRMLNSDDPLTQHPNAINKKTGLINPNFSKLGVLPSNATAEERKAYGKVKTQHTIAIKKAGQQAMRKHIDDLGSKAGLKTDVQGNVVLDTEGVPVPLNLEDSMNDEVDNETRLHVLNTLYMHKVNPLSSAPTHFARKQEAFSKIVTKPVGTPETHPNNFVSAEQLASHKADLESRKLNRDSISGQIGRAREMGDIRENADYDAAKDEQGQNEGKIAFLEDHIEKIENNPSEFEGHYLNPTGVTTASFVDHPTEGVMQQGKPKPEAIYDPKTGKMITRIRGSGPTPRGFYGRNSIPKKVPVLQQKQMPVFETPPSEETVEEPVFKTHKIDHHNIKGDLIYASTSFLRDEKGVPDKDGNFPKIPELGPDGNQLTRTVPKTPGTLARHPETGEVLTTSAGEGPEIYARTAENAKSLGAKIDTSIRDNIYNPQTGEGEFINVSEGLEPVSTKLSDSERRAIADKRNLATKKSDNKTPMFEVEDLIHMALNGTGKFTPVTPSARVSGLANAQVEELRIHGDNLEKRNPVPEGTPTDREYGDVTHVGDDTSERRSQFVIPESTVDRMALAKKMGINQSIVTSSSLSKQKTQGSDYNVKNPTKVAIMRGRLARQNAPQFADYTGGRTPPVPSTTGEQHYPKPETFFEKDRVSAPAPNASPNAYGVVPEQHKAAMERNLAEQTASQQRIASGKTRQEVGQDIIKNNPQSVGLAAIAAASVPNGVPLTRVTQAHQFAPQIMQGLASVLGAGFGGAPLDLELNKPEPTMSSVSGIPKSGMSRTRMSKTMDDGYVVGKSGEAGRKIIANPDYKPTEDEVGEMVHSTTDEGPVTNLRELGRQRKEHEKLTADKNSAISTVAGQLLRSRATGATIGN